MKKGLLGIIAATSFALTSQAMAKGNDTLVYELKATSRIPVFSVLSKLIFPVLTGNAKYYKDTISNEVYGEINPTGGLWQDI